MSLKGDALVATMGAQLGSLFKMWGKLSMVRYAGKVRVQPIPGPSELQGSLGLNQGSLSPKQGSLAEKQGSLGALARVPRPIPRSLAKGPSPRGPSPSDETLPWRSASPRYLPCPVRSGVAHGTAPIGGVRRHASQE